MILQVHQLFNHFRVHNSQPGTKWFNCFNRIKMNEPTVYNFQFMNNFS